MNKAIKKVALISTLGITLNVMHIGGMIMTSTNSMINSPKITTQNQLERLVEERRKLIDPNNNYKIISELVSYNRGVSGILKDGTGYGILIGGDFANVNVLDHELYHILDHHFDNFPKTEVGKTLKYLYWTEPQAIIYQAFGVKL